MADDTIRTERVSITIRGKKGRRTAPRVRSRGPRYGPFTRPVEVDPITTNPPVLLVNAFDPDIGEFGEAVSRAYDLTNPAAPKSPKRISVVLGKMIARTRTDAFPNAQGYAETNSGVEALDLSNPRAPVSTSVCLPATFSQPVLEEGLLYWTKSNFNPTINVVDVTDPAAITVVREYNSVSDFTAKQRFMGTPAIRNNRLYVASAPDFGGTSSGDGEPNSYLATYDFSIPASAVQIDTIILEASATINSVASQKPPVVLGNAVVYVGFQFRDNPIATTYTVKLLTFSLSNPDAPVQVHSLVVSTDGPSPGGIWSPTGAPWQLFINKSKTRLFLFTQTTLTFGGTLYMYDITTPATPVLLDTVVVSESGGGYGVDLSAYAADTGYLYRGNLADGGLIIYKYSNDVFELANTLANASPVLALTKKGFPL